MPAPYNPPWGRGSSGQRPTPDPNVRVSHAERRVLVRVDGKAPRRGRYEITVPRRVPSVPAKVRESSAAPAMRIPIEIGKSRRLADRSSELPRSPKSSRIAGARDS